MYLFTHRGTEWSIDAGPGSIAITAVHADRIATWASFWHYKGKLRWPADVYVLVDRKNNTGWITENGELVHRY